ncbi:MAG: acid--CoA ligase [Candidatus Aminicenantes bacterium]|nr:acid--CoA ligase [Candidatus Aminicenantes bacterium]MDH5385653.1 acid--CoA ligase [Candidatus Aminicenantes bacterium]MDH5743837.1 acid--CoA ligase [Candidatus Aminicenantes bacterium]
MKVISFIEDLKAIDKIICHLKITFQAERPPPSHAIHQELLTVAEENREYF